VKRVLIDTDPGIDDALALWLAFRSPELRVEAVTTVAGNAPVARTTVNARRLIDLLQPTPCPLLARGRDRPLQKDPITAATVHGLDGLGDLDRLRDGNGDPLYPDPALPAPLPQAREVIIELAERYGEGLTVIALGPLSNLGEALLAGGPRVMAIGEVVVMGGAINVPGNVTPAAEFNMFADPDAAHLVLTSGLPIRLIPLDVTQHVWLDQEAIDRLARKIGGSQGRFLMDITCNILAQSLRLHGGPFLTLHDPLAVAVAVDPSLVQTTPFHIVVETQGEVTQGMTLADRRPIPNECKAPPNVQAALQVDVRRFLDLFEERICQRFS
jgi:inosine-uridine nucleoside N-ribohydrolase